MARPPSDRDSPPSPSRTHGLAQRVARLWGGAARDAAGHWQPKDARYPRLQRLDIAASGLAGLSGLYACWHLGVRPRWVRVGAATDVGAAIVRLQQQVDIVRHDANGGLFVAWALLPAEALPGAVGFLAERLNPVLQSLVFAGEVVPAVTAATFSFPPGTRPDTLPVDNPQPQK